MTIPTEMNSGREAVKNRIEGHLRACIAAKEAMIIECTDAIAAAASYMHESLHRDGKILICGNGGSAADSQHIASELVSVLDRSFPRPALAAIALTTDTSFLTASANDFGFDGIFERQVQALGREGDTLIGISASGASENVVRALLEARQRGLNTVALTGASGGRVAEVADATVLVPSETVQHIQECHIAVGHILCDLVERRLFPGKKP